MKPKLSVREREKQRQVLMRGVAAADDRLRMADAACVELEGEVARLQRSRRNWQYVVIGLSAMHLLNAALMVAGWALR